MPTSQPRNRLGDEMSPYLRQHKDNPVHWWPFGPQALAESKRTGKPILLSVGYAACHWCHVMAHESFEDETTAALMNELYINIKVDREERPDIDAIYMAALHRLGEQGGWPLTMFLDTDARPFWGGTYFPPTARYGRPSFPQVLQEIARIYAEQPDTVASNADAITSSLGRRIAPAAGFEMTEAFIKDAASDLAGLMDPERGGMKGAPKFPQASGLWLLWRAGLRYDLKACRDAVTATLTNIAQGGIYDHVGGGFARYSVDDRWLVPHFEKMLYDNAQLIELMSEVYRETRDPLLEVRVAETIDWLAREMSLPSGAFASSLDADSEGEEGRFYVWSKADIEAVLGPEDAHLFSEVYDISDEGNFEGHNIPNRLAHLGLLDAKQETRLQAMRAKLLEARARRIRPGLDDKILADWNGLMMTALAHASQTFARPDWLGLASKAFDVIWNEMRKDGRLAHVHCGLAPGQASDYANVIKAALALYQACGDQLYIEVARELCASLDAHHWVEVGGYAAAPEDAADVIVRLSDAHDDATPNANAVMVSNLMHLYQLTGDEQYRQRADAVVKAFSGNLTRSPIGHSGLIAASLELSAPTHIAIVGDGEVVNVLQTAARSLSMPGALIQVLLDTHTVPERSPLAGKGPIGGKAAAYVCVGQACLPPVISGEDLRALLRKARGHSTP